MRFPTISKSRERGGNGEETGEIHPILLLASYLQFDEIEQSGFTRFLLGLFLSPQKVGGLTSTYHAQVFSLAGVRQWCCLWELVCVSVCGSDQVAFVFSGVFLPMERVYMFLKDQKAAAQGMQASSLLQLQWRRTTFRKVTVEMQKPELQETILKAVHVPEIIQPDQVYSVTLWGMCLSWM